MVGILVLGDNHFIVRGPFPDRQTALARLHQAWRSCWRSCRRGGLRYTTPTSAIGNAHKWVDNILHINALVISLYYSLDTSIGDKPDHCNYNVQGERDPGVHEGQQNRERVN